MPSISQRGTRLPSSPIRKLVPLSDAAKREGVKVYHLNIGQPDLPTPPKGLEALKHITRTTLEYSPSEGILPLREKMSAYYARFGLQVAPSEIIVTTGGSEAILFAFLACLDPGDEIVMLEPVYANYITLAQAAGVVVKTVTARIEDGFALPPVSAFEAAITERTRGILLCHPSNPTGTVYDREELLQLKRLVLKYNLYLFSDEVYREFVYNDVPFVSALALDIPEHVVVLDSVSKRYSACGIRVGMLVSLNPEVRAAVMKLCQARLSPPLLGQIVAEASIEGTEDYARACYEEYKARRDFFIEGLNQIPDVYSPMPQGAFYTVASLPVEDAEDFCRWLLTDFRQNGETVMMAPAAGFYATPGMGRNEVRLAYVLKKQDLARALELLRASLEAYNKK
ncbi:MAG: pyridoxal phosphate-dependent aminotransferase [Bacteroidales bacterium]|nr:pyridoxal phosphate-dependent aminotransferase [Bacteroidales bacterium]